tara:strand:+ start:792 stop:1880 length:1089 start_codon:yes stop_codon:yes gene_type:complete
LKILLLVAGSRSGSDFFQSLLDGHDEICQFPGLIHYDNNFKKLFLIDNLKKLAINFTTQYPHFFNSKKATLERHNKLGKNKNEFYIVNKKKFIKEFIKLMKKNKKNSFGILKCLHLAFSLASKEKINNKKIILINIHLVNYAFEFVNDFDDYHIEILHTIRNPLSAISSPVKNWLKYKKGKNFGPVAFFFHFNLVLQGINDLCNLKKKIRIIQLEKVHKKNKVVMKDFCKIYKIKFNSNLSKSTFQKKLWWGDEISKKYLNGVNKNYKISIEKKLFFERDLNYFNYIFKNIIKFYGYKLYLKKDKFKWYYFLPLKIEILILLNSLKLKNLKYVIFSPIFYFLRIYKTLTFNKNFKKFPNSIG